MDRRGTHCGPSGFPSCCEGHDHEPRSLDVQVTPLFDPQGRGLGASVTFADASRVQELQQQLFRSKQDLETTYEELQSTNEELETTSRA
jgi:two-component system CheB/CheR fusion protein